MKKSKFLIAPISRTTQGREHIFIKILQEKRKYMRNILFVGFIFFGVVLNAQNFTGRIIDEQAKPFPFVNILLLNPIDSTFITGATSNDDGRFSIKSNLENGLLKISSIGYHTKYLNVKAGNVGDLQMQPSEQNLQEVIVKGNKPIIRREQGKTVFDIKLMSNVETMKAIDVMKFAPGVVITSGGAILVAGKEAAVFVDDRQLLDEELRAYLKSVRASDIDCIEVMRNHGGIHDAGIAGGVINIITKKNRMGVDGSAEFFASTPKSGFYNHTSAMNIFFGYKRWNIYGIYSYTQGRADQYSETTNNYLYNDTQHHSIGNYLSNQKEHLYRVGAMCNITPKHLLGFELNGISTPPTTDSGHNAQIYHILKQAYNGNATQTYQSHSDFYNIVGSYSWNIDDRKSFLKLLFNYNDKKSLSHNELYSRYPGLLGHDIEEHDVTNAKGQNTSYKIDFRKNQANGWSIRIGGKFLYSKCSSMFNSSDYISGISSGTDWKYKENIAGGYVGVSKEAGKWYLCGIMRVENTNVKGYDADKSMEKKYTDWIPYLYASYTTSQRYNYSLSYTRTIYRPPFSLMNSYVNRISDVLYDKGNPELKSELTDVVEFSASHGNHSVAMTFRHKPNAITELYEVKDGITYHTNVNYGRESTAMLGYSYSGNIKSWWQSNFYVAGTYTNIPKSYNKRQLFGGLMNWNNRFYWDKVGVFSMGIYYVSPTIFGNSYQKGYTTFDLSAEHSFFKNKLTAQVGVQDLFNSSKIVTSNKIPTLDYNVYLKNQTRYVWCRLIFYFSTKAKVDKNRIQNDNNIGTRL